LLEPEEAKGGQDMEKTKDVTPGHKVDMPELLSRVDNDRELLRDLLTIFRDDFPRRLEDLRRAVASQDRNAAKIVSHTLKGMLSNLAVTRAASSASRLELAAAAPGDPLAPAMAEFERDIDGLLAEMESYLAEVQP
jgi:HPt (histidine-containing phosphotransfer) domain-containing protein